MGLSEHQWRRPSTSNCTLSAHLESADTLVAAETVVEVMVVAVAAVQLVAAAVTAVTTGWTARNLFVETARDLFVDMDVTACWTEGVVLVGDDVIEIMAFNKKIKTIRIVR
jgi:hypothetical protein